MKPVLISIPSNYPLHSLIIEKWGLDALTVNFRNFPDGEIYLKIDGDLQGREVIFLCELDRPNDKILPLLFALYTAKDLGAKSVGLCAPYLPYMRQDKRFHEGEGVTAPYFANLLSGHFDWIVTIDPHLHRFHNLEEIYSIPNKVLHATSEISRWIANHIDTPLIIGPDSESEQWVQKVASEAGAPHLILEKIRRGDEDVTVSKPKVDKYLNYIPVLVDDIISTAHTMIETVSQLKKLGMNSPICIGVHAIFSGSAYDKLLNVGAEKVITCNTITHKSNQIDISNLLINGLVQIMQSKY